MTIRLDAAEGQAHICSTWPVWSRKLQKLYGEPKQVTEQGGKVAAAWWTIPLPLVTLRRGVRHARSLTAAQRAQVGDRLRQARQAPATPSEPC